MYLLVSVVNLLKTITTMGAIFSLQLTKNRLAAGLHSDPLGKLERSPRTPIRNRGLLLRGRERRKGRGKEGTEKEGKEGEKDLHESGLATGL